MIGKLAQLAVVIFGIIVIISIIPGLKDTVLQILGTIF